MVQLLVLVLVPLLAGAVHASTVSFDRGWSFHRGDCAVVAETPAPSTSTSFTLDASVQTNLDGCQIEGTAPVYLRSGQPRSSTAAM